MANVAVKNGITGRRKIWVQNVTTNEEEQRKIKAVPLSTPTPPIPPLHGSVFFKKIKFKVFMRPAICYAAPLSTAHGKL